MPILSTLFPSTDLGEGIPDIDLSLLCEYLLILTFLLEVMLKKQFKMLSKWILFMSMYSMVVVASVLWTNYSYNSAVLHHLFHSVLIPLIVAIIGLNIFSKRDNKDAYIKNIIFAAFILSLLSMYQMLATYATVAGNVKSSATSDELRSMATFGNPNSLAIFLVLTIPCLVYAIEKKMVPKIVGWVFSATLAVGIIFTISRKGITTGILAFFLYYLLKGKFKKNVALGYMVAILFIIFSGYNFISDRFSQAELDRQFSGKWDMTVAGLKMYIESPLIGLGYKGYYDNYGKYFPWASRKKYDAHNMYITALANYGLIGFIPFLGIIFYPLFYSGKILRQYRIKNNRENCRDMTIICISSIIPFAISGWFAGGMFYSSPTLFLLYTNIALFLATCRLSSNDEQE